MDRIETNIVDKTSSDGQLGAVSRAATDIRSLVLQRVFLPGEQVRQEDVAQQLGISRGPIREALQVLAVEGVLRYERNRGYFVTRFTADEMQQLYLIRDLLESEILARLDPVPASTLERLREINEKIRSGGVDLQTVIQLNRSFHDLIFSASPLHILKAQLDHVSRMTMAYQALAINALDGWELLASDHDRIIAALEAGDNERLVNIHCRHREASLTRLVPILA